MVALYRAGRQADALELYRRTRARMSEELGIEPSPQLQALERAILNHDPALAGRPAARRMAVKRRGAKLLLAVLCRRSGSGRRCRAADSGTPRDRHDSAKRGKQYDESSKQAAAAVSNCSTDEISSRETSTTQSNAEGDNSDRCWR